MSNEFTPATNTTEPAKGLYESVDELSAECTGATMHDPYDREKLYSLIAKATILSDIATELDVPELADRCNLRIDTLQDALDQAAQAKLNCLLGEDLYLGYDEGLINELLDDPNSDLEDLLS